MNLRYSVLAFVLTATLCPAAEPTKADLNVIRERVRAKLLPGCSVEAGVIARGHVESLKENGSWADIPYGSKAATGWPVLRHLSRLNEIAHAIATEGSPIHNDPKAKDAAMRALNFWINGNFQSRNWWYNQIATPGSLSSAILRLGVPLTPDQSAKAMRYIGRASVKPGGNTYKDWMAGANFVHQAESVLSRGLIENDLALVTSVFSVLDQRLGEIKGGGIQPDYTFHQHGPTLLNKGYGSLFALSATDLIKLANGTGFAFSPETISVINNFLLDGLQWMEYRGTYEYAATGRGLSSPQSGRLTVGGLAEVMFKIPGDRTEELKAAAMRSRGDADAPPLVGNRHFWHSDIMVHRRADYYTSARGHSTRTISTDYVDNRSVNKLAGHVADGANYLFRTGKEYDDIFPVWDWYKVPGTTVAQLVLQRNGLILADLGGLVKLTALEV